MPQNTCQGPLSLQPLKRSPAERSLPEYTPHPRSQSGVNPPENPPSLITLITLPRFVCQETVVLNTVPTCASSIQIPAPSYGSQSLEFGKGLNSGEGIPDAAAGQRALHSINIPGVFLHELGTCVLASAMAVGSADSSGASHGLPFRNPSGFTLSNKPAWLKLFFPHSQWEIPSPWA